MIKIHYAPLKPSHDPYGEDTKDKGYCGTYLSERWDNSSRYKEDVTCKKCIALFPRADDEIRQINESIRLFHESFVEFMEKEHRNELNR